MIQSKRVFEKYFRDNILPEIRDSYEQNGRIDFPARREAWNNVIDSLLKDREITHRAEFWECPW